MQSTNTVGWSQRTELNLGWPRKWFPKFREIQNLAKYIFIFTKICKIYRYEFCKLLTRNLILLNLLVRISARNLISRNSAKSSHYRFYKLFCALFWHFPSELKWTGNSGHFYTHYVLLRKKCFFHSYKGLFAVFLQKNVKFAKKWLKTSKATKLGSPVSQNTKLDEILQNGFGWNFTKFRLKSFCEICNISYKEQIFRIKFFFK